VLAPFAIAMILDAALQLPFFIRYKIQNASRDTANYRATVFYKLHLAKHSRNIPTMWLSPLLPLKALRDTGAQSEPLVNLLAATCNW